MGNQKSSEWTPIIIAAIILAAIWIPILMWLFGLFDQPSSPTRYQDMTTKEYNQFQEWNSKQERKEEDSKQIFK